MSPIFFLLLAAVCAFSWTFVEYTMHRFAMHELKGKGKASREHLRHHAGIDATAGTSVLSWTGVFVVGAFVHAPVGFLIAGVPGAVVAWSGWVAGYGAYEYLHWASHRFAPSSRYSTWLRRHHFHHHFGAPMKNHGVTTPIWDHVFRTYERPEVINVPRRLAMEWLLDEHGHVKPEFAEDYVVRGRRADRDGAEVERDRADAFANLAPTM
jgi:sterol desaturase/sphingolipid hydroxylase (fatty acid hydroxylase superfamily)